MNTDGTPFDGGCTCRRLRYRLTSRPLFVHCCRCCQRETGTACALDALIEADPMVRLQGDAERIDTPSESGKGQKVWRCQQGRIASWSNYSGAGDAVHFVRVGTLDAPDRHPPDIHIDTESKQPWIILPGATPAVPQNYRASEYWPSAGLARPQQQPEGQAPGRERPAPNTR